MLFVLLALTPLLLAAQEPQPQPSWQLDRLRTECIDFGVSGQYVEGELVCRVLEFGELGIVGETQFYYGLYRLKLTHPDFSPDTLEMDSYNRPPLNQTAVAIFRARDDASALLDWKDVADYVEFLSWFEKPDIIEAPFGTVLSIPERISGTAAANDDKYFRWIDDRWRLLDTTSWTAALRDSLPEGQHVWKGLQIDIRSLSVESGVWRDGDANCCPTGGTVHVQLRLEGDALTIERLEHRKPPEQGLSHVQVDELEARFRTLLDGLFGGDG
jgi:hypothetical protein